MIAGGTRRIRLYVIGDQTRGNFCIYTFFFILLFGSEYGGSALPPPERKFLIVAGRSLHQYVTVRARRGF